MKKLIGLIVLMFVSYGYSDIWTKNSGWPKQPSGFYNQYIESVMTDIDHDSDLEIVIIDSDSVGVMNSSGSFLSGWPKNLSNYVGPLAVADVGGTSDLEIIVLEKDITNTEFIIHVFELDGDYVSGWPKTISKNPTRGGGIMSDDLDDDGDSEIVMWTWTDGDIHVFSGDGSYFDSVWPETYGSGLDSVCTADINDDGEKDLIFRIGPALSNNYKVYAVEHDGDVITGWPFEADDQIVTNVVVGDMDGDSVPEIAFATTAEELYVVDVDGDLYPTATPTWPVSLSGNPSFIILGDLDGNSGAEMLVSGYGNPYIDAIDIDGDHVSGWPAIVDEAYDSLPYYNNRVQSIGNFDDDSDNEVLVGTLVGIYLFDNNGDEIDGFGPMSINGISGHTVSHHRSIHVGDFDFDTKTDVLISIFGKIHAYEVDDGNLSDIEWARFRNDLGATGFYNP